MRARAWTLVGVLLTAVVFAGCQSSPPSGPAHAPVAGGASGDAVEIVMVGSQYSPAKITIEVGTTVTWINDDPMGHTVTPTDTAQWGTEGSGDDFEAWLQRGESWSWTFTAPGEYEYYCLPHAARGADGNYRGMVGKVVVTPRGAAAGAGITSTTVVPSPLAPPRSLPDADGVVRLHLETREVVAQISDDASYAFWTFNGTVPAPMLRVEVGDTVELTLANAADSRFPHSIDLHAVTGPGGGAVATQTPPGETRSFRFKALAPGLYVYHCATPHVPSHVANGMYGLILVEPRGGLPPVDREFFVVQGELYPTGKLGEAGHHELDGDKLLDERPEYYLFNGRVGALTGPGALTAKVGDRVRIHFGVGGFVPSSFHVIGEIFDRVYPEGGSPPVANVQTTLVPAGGATIVEFVVDAPGTYVLVDHSLSRAIDRGAAGILIVEGPADHEVFHAEGATSAH